MLGRKLIHATPALSGGAERSNAYPESRGGRTASGRERRNANDRNIPILREALSPIIRPLLNLPVSLPLSRILAQLVQRLRGRFSCQSLWPSWPGRIRNAGALANIRRG